jgi:CDP-glucose 4,6-dehydratase
MKNILITGANGFIGSHLVNSLKRENNVVSLIHNQIPSKWLRESLEGSIQVDCDIRDYHSLRRILARYQIDQVYHTAALSLVKTAFRDPIGVFEINAMGTANLLEASRQAEVNRILVMNTDKIYGEGLDADEDRPYQPGEPYQSSKCCQGFIAESFRKTYDMSIVMSHCCNVFGYDPFSNRIFPNVIKSCFKGKNPLIFTNDSSIREYVYVEEKIDAIQELINDETKQGSYNISTGWTFNQEEIVLKILERFPSLEPSYVEGDVPQQINKQSLTSNRWHWTPKKTFDESVESTINLFSKYKSDWL